MYVAGGSCSVAWLHESHSGLCPGSIFIGNNLLKVSTADFLRGMQSSICQSIFNVLDLLDDFYDILITKYKSLNKQIWKAKATDPQPHCFAFQHSAQCWSSTSFLLPS